MVKVYSIPDCGWCKKTKAYLNQRGVDFIDINVEEDMEGRKEMKSLTENVSIPLINIDGHLVHGFDIDKIDEYLNL